MKKAKRIAWGITGSGHYLKESMQIIDGLSDIDIFLSKAGEEVLKWYDYDLKVYKKRGVKIFKDINDHRDGSRSFYCEDPDGTLIEMIEVYKIPIIEKLGLYLNVEKRAASQALPNWMLKALKFTRVKD